MVADEENSGVIRVLLSSCYAEDKSHSGYSVACDYYNPRSGFCAQKESLEEIADKIKTESDARKLCPPFYLISPDKGPLALGFFEKLFGAKREYTIEATSKDISRLISLLK